jgi:signal transduction histidine kinase
MTIMPDRTDRTHYSQDNEFHALCQDWRLRMLDALRDYSDSITALDDPRFHPALLEHYGVQILSLLSELRQSAIRITAMIDDRPDPHTNDSDNYLASLFVDIRNPVSSFSMLDRIVESALPARADANNEVQARMQHLVKCGQDLNRLVDDLLSLRKRFTAGT